MHQITIFRFEGGDKEKKEERVWVGERERGEEDYVNLYSKIILEYLLSVIIKGMPYCYVNIWSSFIDDSVNTTHSLMYYR